MLAGSDRPGPRTPVPRQNPVRRLPVPSRTSPAAIRRARGEPDAEYDVLPLRMEVGEVEALDAAWKAAGFSSRAAFVREAISAKVAEQAAG